MQNVTASLFRLDNAAPPPSTWITSAPPPRPATATTACASLAPAASSNTRRVPASPSSPPSPPRDVRDLPQQQSVFLDFLRGVYQGAAPALSWPEIVRANEATLAAHTAAVQHRFVAILEGPQSEPRP